MNLKTVKTDFNQVDLAVGHLHHYRSYCVDLVKDCKESYLQHTVKDSSVWTWKDAVSELHLVTKYGSKWTRRKSDGKYKASKWKWNFSQNTPFLEKMYWLPYGTNRLAQNPNLVENPGY